MVVLNGHPEPSLAKGDVSPSSDRARRKKILHITFLHQHLAIGGLENKLNNSLAERQSGKKTMCSGFYAENNKWC